MKRRPFTSMSLIHTNRKNHMPPIRSRADALAFMTFLLAGLCPAAVGIYALFFQA